MKFLRAVFTCGALGAAFALAPVPAPAQIGPRLAIPFQTHATFFSRESGQTGVLDPQVFENIPGAEAGSGPQNIVHSAGFRPARGGAAPSAPLFNAVGAALNFTLEKWFAAGGQAEIYDNGPASDHVWCYFNNLVPGGYYSLFENHFSATGVTFTPLDGSGTGNSFTANASGTGYAQMITSDKLTNATAILLVYHSDGSDHGTSRGDLGVNAHHQLIARPPR